jgi:hypothetical protein
VLKVEGNGFVDKTYILFDELATGEFDNHLDAYKLFGAQNAPQIYSADDNNSYSINALPYIAEEFVIPIALKVGKQNQYTLSVDENNIPETIGLVLEDRQTREQYNLHTQSEITINHNPSNFPDRFLLLVNALIGLEEQMSDNEGTNIFVVDNEIFITGLAGESVVSVFNMVGQVVYTETLSRQNKHSILINDGPGYYLVRVKNGNNITTKKALIW